ncbi:MAG: Predicted mannose-6-phosphate isomerase [uncultured Caballeronia sp.]|nr:MAG: Predicted mannose-6-phosphate isomerase [uncultured Caballeronia sp.]
MNRAAAIDAARVGAQKIWAGTVTIHPNAKTGAYHHGALESVIYIVRGQARMRWGEHLEFTAEAGPGDFIFVPPYVPHQEINASTDEPLECVLVRSDNEAIVVNLNIDAAETPEEVSIGGSIRSTSIRTTTEAGDWNARRRRNDGGAQLASPQRRGGAFRRG